MAVEIESRAYGPESSEAEREAIKSRVSVIEDRVLYFRSIPQETPFTVDMMFDRLEELSADWDSFYIVRDFSQPMEINAETRAEVIERFSRFKHKVRHVALISDVNVFLRVTIRFLAARSSFFRYSVHRAFDEALEKVHQAKSQEA
jgi:hypothetical protein